MAIVHHESYDITWVFPQTFLFATKFQLDEVSGSFLLQSRKMYQTLQMNCVSNEFLLRKKKKNRINRLTNARLIKNQSAFCFYSTRLISYFGCFFFFISLNSTFIARFIASAILSLSLTTDVFNFIRFQFSTHFCLRSDISLQNQSCRL